MPIDYDPKQAETCWPEGDYDAVLSGVKDAVSKSSGQDMQVWTITLYNSSGAERTVKDYVTAAAAFKLKQLAIALGKRSDFEAGRFQADDHIGAGFTAEVLVEQQDGYDDQNKVKKYKARSSPVGVAPTPVHRAPMTSDLRARAKANAPVSAPLGGPGVPEEDIPFAPVR